MLRHDVTCDGILGSYKGTPAHNRVSFFALQQALCVIVCLIWCCLSQAIYIILASGHTCLGACLGAQHARAALEGAACVDCEALPIRVLRSRLAVFDKARLARPAVRHPRPPRRRGGLDRGARRFIC